MTPRMFPLLGLPATSTQQCSAWHTAVTRPAAPESLVQLSGVLGDYHIRLGQLSHLSCEVGFIIILIVQMRRSRL